MSNIFNIKRFGEYLLYDLNRLKSRYLLGIVTLGVIPIAAFLCEYVSVLVQKLPLTEIDTDVNIAIITALMLFYPIFFPAKYYGYITDKKAGSDWALLPASALEKFLSMLIITLIVAPVLVFAVLLLSEFLISLVVPEVYTELRILSMFDFVSVEAAVAAIFSMVNTVLCFTLGAVCFKKAKMAKTLLAMFAVSLILTALVFLVGNLILDSGAELFLDLEQIFKEADMLSFLNVLINLALFGTAALLAAGIFWRLKTIKY